MARSSSAPVRPRAANQPSATAAASSAATRRRVSGSMRSCPAERRANLEQSWQPSSSPRMRESAVFGRSNVGSRFAGMPPASGRRLAQLGDLPEDHLALEAGEVVDEEHALEMVHLVLEARRRACRRYPPRGRRPARRASGRGCGPGGRPRRIARGPTGSLRYRAPPGPNGSRISGLMKTRGSRTGSPPSSSGSCRSMTSRRFGTPTWTAARPMPGAAYIVSNMSAISARVSSVDRLDGGRDLAQARIGHFEDGEQGHGWKIRRKPRFFKHWRTGFVAHTPAPFVLSLSKDCPSFVIGQKGRASTTPDQVRAERLWGPRCRIA